MRKDEIKELLVEMISKKELYSWVKWLAIENSGSIGVYTSKPVFIAGKWMAQYGQLGCMGNIGGTPKNPHKCCFSIEELQNGN